MRDHGRDGFEPKATAEHVRFPRLAKRRDGGQPRRHARADLPLPQFSRILLSRSFTHTHQAEHRAQIRHGFVQAIGNLHQRAQDRFDFDTPAGFRVAQH